MRRPEIGVTVAGNAQNLFDGETLPGGSELGARFHVGKRRLAPHMVDFLRLLRCFAAQLPFRAAGGANVGENRRAENPFCPLGEKQTTGSRSCRFCGWRDGVGRRSAQLWIWSFMRKLVPSVIGDVTAK